MMQHGNNMAPLSFAITLPPTRTMLGWPTNASVSFGHVCMESAAATSQWTSLRQHRWRYAFRLFYGSLGEAVAWLQALYTDNQGKSIPRSAEISNVWTAVHRWSSGLQLCRGGLCPIGVNSMLLDSMPSTHSEGTQSPGDALSTV
jgi:hypothetical protein